MSTEIKILHAACCAKSSPIKRRLERIAEKHQLDFNIEELSELQDTMVYGTMTFPSLVINGKVYDYRELHEVKTLLEIVK